MDREPVIHSQSQRKKLVHLVNNVSKISSFLNIPYFWFAFGIHKNCELAIEARGPTKILALKSMDLPWLIYKLIIKIEATYFSAYQIML